MKFENIYKAQSLFREISTEEECIKDIEVIEKINTLVIRPSETTTGRVAISGGEKDVVIKALKDYHLAKIATIKSDIEAL